MPVMGANTKHLLWSPDNRDRMERVARFAAVAHAPRATCFLPSRSVTVRAQCGMKMLLHPQDGPILQLTSRPLEPDHRSKVTKIS
jgi:hypothetical protein